MLGTDENGNGDTNLYPSKGDRKENTEVDLKVLSNVVTRASEKHNLPPEGLELYRIIAPMFPGVSFDTLRSKYLKTEERRLKRLSKIKAINITDDEEEAKTLSDKVTNVVGLLESEVSAGTNALDESVIRIEAPSLARVLEAIDLSEKASISETVYTLKPDEPFNKEHSQTDEIIKEQSRDESFQNAQSLGKETGEEQFQYEQSLCEQSQNEQLASLRGSVDQVEESEGLLTKETVHSSHSNHVEGLGKLPNAVDKKVLQPNDSIERDITGSKALLTDNKDMLAEQFVDKDDIRAKEFSNQDTDSEKSSQSNHLLVTGSKDSLVSEKGKMVDNQVSIGKPSDEELVKPIPSVSESSTMATKSIRDVPSPSFNETITIPIDDSTLIIKKNTAKKVATNKKRPINVLVSSENPKKPHTIELTKPDIVELLKAPPLESKMLSQIDSLIEELIQEHQVPREVVIYALYAHSGKVENARRYLAGQVDKPTWDILDDTAILTRNYEEVIPLLTEKGDMTKEDILERVQFLNRFCDCPHNTVDKEEEEEDDDDDEYQYEDQEEEEEDDDDSDL